MKKRRFVTLKNFFIDSFSSVGPNLDQIGPTIHLFKVDIEDLDENTHIHELLLVGWIVSDHKKVYKIWIKDGSYLWEVLYTRCFPGSHEMYCSPIGTSYCMVFLYLNHIHLSSLDQFQVPQPPRTSNSSHERVNWCWYSIEMTLQQAVRSQLNQA